jgi:hypothetical protein
LSPRFNSTLSQYNNQARRYSNKARRFVRKHTRMSVAVAAATAVAGIGAASAVVGSAPWAQAATNTATANYAGPGTPAGQAGGTIVRSIFGVHLKSDADQGRAASQRQAPSQSAPSQPYLIYDSVEPSTVPAGQPVATYADGPFAASPYEVAGHGNVMWIDTNGSDPQASALDVEPGDATPGIAAQWVQQKLTSQPKASAVVYTSLAEWPQVQAAVGTLPSSMQSHVKYWVADPTGTPHMVPGASATQWYWGSTYDISTAQPGF